MAEPKNRRLVTEKRGFRVKPIKHPRYSYVVYRIADGEQDPKTAAHVAIAFDTFESRVVPHDNRETRTASPLMPSAGFLSSRGNTQALLPPYGAAPFCPQLMARSIRQIEHTPSV